MLLEEIAKKEEISLKKLKKHIEEGRVVLLKNRKRKSKPLAIGEDLSIKINTNIGTSSRNPEITDELKKAQLAEEMGSDTIMDLSVSDDCEKLRKLLLQKTKLPLGTVPVYEAAIRAEKKYGSFERMEIEDILEVIEKQAKEGVDFFTIHCGITKEIVWNLSFKKRTAGIVSRGGAIITRWIIANNKENPFYEHFSEILNIAKKYNVVLSLGDGLRPGSIIDSLDEFQIKELLNLGRLSRICLNKEVGVIIEGPGHVPINQIETNVILEKQICSGIPFYVLGPLVTDIALGFDHIASAIGSSLAALAGADFLCVVTPREHLGHPDLEDIKRGVIASKIAAHSVNLLKKKTFLKKDLEISQARKKRKWQKQIKYAIDTSEAKEMIGKLKLTDICSMCGKYCSLKIIEDCPAIV